MPGFSIPTDSGAVMNIDKVKLAGITIGSANISAALIAGTIAIVLAV